MSFILEFASRSILSLIGWNRMDRHEISRLHLVSKPRILLIKHSSYFDYIFSVLYIWSEGISDKFSTIMSRFVVDKWPWAKPFFDFTNVVLVKKKEDGVDNTISQLTEQYKNRPVNIMIAPSGTVNLQDEWKSGWWYLAKALDAEIGVIGVDYYPTIRRTTLKGVKNVSEFEDKAAAENWLRAEMEKINARSEVTCSMIDWVYLSNWLVLPLLLNVFKYDVFMGILGTVNLYYSMMYHKTYEQSQYYHDCDMGCSKISLMYILNAFMKLSLILKLSITPFLAITGFLWVRATGREQSFLRNKHYELFHSLFHVFLSFSTTLIFWFRK